VIRRIAAVGGLVWALGAGAGVAAPGPVLTLTAAGQFEIASVDAGAARRTMDEAAAAWRWLAGPLGLPAGFPSAILVRLVPAAEWGESAPFRVFAEPGGVVSLRVRWSEMTAELYLRRALVQALLVRSAVALHGAKPELAAPLWLEQAGVQWWRTREEPAQLDALVQESAALAPPPLAAVLTRERGDVEPRTLTVGAAWLLTWLQAESGPAGEWPALRARLLGGAEPLAALAASFPGRFADAAERELWWQTGWHHVRRLPTQAALGSAESRRRLADLERCVLSVGGEDTRVPLRFVLRRSEDAAVAALLAARVNELQRILPALHPFYRNAGLALADCIGGGAAKPEVIDARCEALAREWRDAVELETTAREALDALGRGR
jgi:hypothetical protein